MSTPVVRQPFALARKLFTRLSALCPNRGPFGTLLPLKPFLLGFGFLQLLVHHRPAYHGIILALAGALVWLYQVAPL